MPHPPHAPAALLAATLLALAGPARAQEIATPAPMPDPAAGGGAVGNYFTDWFARSDAARASQPHWMTPLVTVTPRLEQEFRYDQYWQHLGNGANIDQYDSGKGLELIPTTTNELLLNLPPYLDRSVRKPASGWGDWPFLVVKQRLLSANEQNGNYIVTAFLGLQAPTGNAHFTNNAWIVTPTLAAGKGWGDFDIQSTLSLAIPASHGDVMGTALTWNTAYQYHLGRVFWPEIETNLTHWYGGQRDGKTQLFLTFGAVLGRFQLYDRLNLAIGLGYQTVVTPKLSTKPVLTPTYDHAWLISARLPF